MNQSLSREEVKKGFKLNLSTNGHCFFCLKPEYLAGLSNAVIKTKNEKEAEETFPVLNQINAKDLFNDFNIDLEHAAEEVAENDDFFRIGVKRMGGLASFESYNLTLALCETCQWKVEKVAKLLRELERIKLELTSSFTSMRQDIIGGNEDLNLSSMYQERMFQDSSLLLMSGLISNLREKMTAKCEEYTVPCCPIPQIISCYSAVNSEKIEMNSASSLPHSLNENEEFTEDFKLAEYQVLDFNKENHSNNSDKEEPDMSSHSPLSKITETQSAESPLAHCSKFPPEESKIQNQRLKRSQRGVRSSSITRSKRVRQSIEKTNENENSKIKKIKRGTESYLSPKDQTALENLTFDSTKNTWICGFEGCGKTIRQRYNAIRHYNFIHAKASLGKPIKNTKISSASFLR